MYRLQTRKLFVSLWFTRDPAVLMGETWGGKESCKDQRGQYCKAAGCHAVPTREQWLLAPTAQLVESCLIFHSRRRQMESQGHRSILILSCIHWSDGQTSLQSAGCLQASRPFWLYTVQASFRVASFEAALAAVLPSTSDGFGVLPTAHALQQDYVLLAGRLRHYSKRQKRE